MFVVVRVSEEDEEELVSVPERRDNSSSGLLLLFENDFVEPLTLQKAITHHEGSARAVHVDEITPGPMSHHLPRSAYDLRDWYSNGSREVRHPLPLQSVQQGRTRLIYAANLSTWPTALLRRTISKPYLHRSPFLTTFMRRCSSRQVRCHSYERPASLTMPPIYDLQVASLA